MRSSLCSIVGSGHTTVRCATPAGVGAGYTWTLSVAGQSSAPSTQTTSFGRPFVGAVTVTGLQIVDSDAVGAVPTAGGATVTLTGVNFGADDSRVVVVWNGTVLPTVALTVPHTALSFASLPGEGDGVNLTVTVGGQASVGTVRIPFAAPRVSFLRLDKTLDREASMDCSAVGADGRPTTSIGVLQRAVVVIRGVNFGLGNATVVTIRGVPCILRAPVEDSQIVCQTPLCTGPVRLTVAGVPSRVEVAFSYNALTQPPRIFRVSPLVGPAAGGTRVTIIGDSFGDLAVVALVERDANGVLTGNRPECVWRSMVGMGCNDTVIQCLSPALTTAGRSWDVSVTASGSLTVYVSTDMTESSRWAFEAPVVEAVSHVELPPQAPLGANITISGRNFGALVGVVTVGLRVLECPVWTDAAIVCAQPPGVGAKANLTVMAANGVPSPQVGNATQLTFSPPAELTVEPAAVLSGTAGGGTLYVAGISFAHPLPVAVWLVRWRGAFALPWNSSGPATSRDALQCPVNPGTLTTTSLVCTIPPGAGTGWGLVVVNMDDSRLGPNATEAALLLRWRASPPALTFSLAFAPPVLASVRLGAGVGSGAPALGSFSLRLIGEHFGPSAPLVTVGSLPCVVLPGAHSHDSLVCTAPLRQVDGDSLVRVTVDGQSSQPLAFAYDPPMVTQVVPAELLALAPAGRPRLTLYGLNFGGRYRTDVRTVHEVTVGPLACGSVVWVGDSELSCVPEGEVITGPLNVTLTVAGEPSAPVTIMAGCAVNWFARFGDRCAPCPTGGRCLGGVADPVSLPGHFPLSTAVFVQCIPRTACAGNISYADLGFRSSSRSAGCAALYTGDRCAECAVGAYRLKGKCASCPNTAWLLFLGFALVVVAAVIAAVYLSGKRINMAGLSIGVVR